MLPSNSILGMLKKRLSGRVRSVLLCSKCFVSKALSLHPSRAGLSAGTHSVQAFPRSKSGFEIYKSVLIRTLIGLPQ